MSQTSLKNELIESAIRTQNNPFLYEFMKHSKELVFVTDFNKDWDLWHRRLGHLSDEYINKLN